MNLTTIKKRSRLGFTLVELIVVIAILAILAGIAIPVYSNYIKKANQAADLTLLDAVNTAFAAALLENNVQGKVAPFAATLKGSDAIEGVTCDENGVEASFDKYFEGNTGALKYYTNAASDFVFDGEVFVDTADYVEKAWSGSSFTGKTEEMAASVVSVSNLISASFNHGTASAIMSMLNNPDNGPALQAALNALGMTDFLAEVAALDESANVGLFSVKYIAAETAGASASNAMVAVNNLMAAMNDTSGEVVDLAGFTVPASMASALTANGDSGVTNLAYAYAAATGFYNSTYGEGVTPPTVSSVGNMMNYMTTAMKNENFTAYLANQAQADVGAYIAAMSVVNANADNITSLDNDTVSALLAAYFG